jgi:hypothetical protein
MSSVYWVIGGEYSDTHFTKIVEGSAKAFGPFRNYDDAKRVWREHSLESRHQAHTRFTIATEGVPAAQAKSAAPIVAAKVAAEPAHAH